MFDLLIIGAGPAGISCGLVLSSAKDKEYMNGKRVGMIAYNKARDLDVAILNNQFGVPSNTKGKELITTELERLESFGFVAQLEESPITEIAETAEGFEVKTEANSYLAKEVVLAIGHSPKIEKIKGLESYITAHTKSLEGQKKFALQHNELEIKEGLYAAGLTADCESQAIIAAGSGAKVALQLMKKWNNGQFDHHHDK